MVIIRGLQLHLGVVKDWCAAPVLLLHNFPVWIWISEYIYLTFVSVLETQWSCNKAALFCWRHSSSNGTETCSVGARVWRRTWSHQICFLRQRISNLSGLQKYPRHFPIPASWGELLSDSGFVFPSKYVAQSNQTFTLGPAAAAVHTLSVSSRFTEACLSLHVDRPRWNPWGFQEGGGGVKEPKQHASRVSQPQSVHLWRCRCHNGDRE